MAIICLDVSLHLEGASPVVGLEPVHSAVFSTFSSRVRLCLSGLFGSAMLISAVREVTSHHSCFGAFGPPLLWARLRGWVSLDERCQVNTGGLCHVSNNAVNTLRCRATALAATGRAPLCGFTSVRMKACGFFGKRKKKE